MKSNIYKFIYAAAITFVIGLLIFAPLLSLHAESGHVLASYSYNELAGGKCAYIGAGAHYNNVCALPAVSLLFALLLPNALDKTKIMSTSTTLLFVALTCSFALSMVLPFYQLVPFIFVKALPVHEGLSLTAAWGLYVYIYVSILLLAFMFLACFKSLRAKLV